MTCRILIVDDSPSFRKGIKALLEIQPDMQVAGVAPDGQEALDLISTLSPDLVLLDAQMPGKTGIEVAPEMKSLCPETKIIMMTLYPDYRSRAVEAGVDAFLTKGIPPEHLLTVIRGVMAKSSNREEDPQDPGKKGAGGPMDAEKKLKTIKFEDDKSSTRDGE